MKNLQVALAMMLSLFGIAPVSADWKPQKPVEFIVTAGPGGGTDNFARTIQAIAVKYKLLEQSIVVLTKGGGSGAEGFVYGKSGAGDPHKVVFATNNEYLLPLVTKMAWKGDDLTPVAAMALDEFILWVAAQSPYRDAKSYIDAVKAKPSTFKMGGSQSKDTDQTLTSMIESTMGTKFLYVPFKSGGEAAVQLAGAHIDSNVNNPSENIGQWKANLVRPLCVFSTSKLASGPKVTAEAGWSDIPTCKESGIAIDRYQQPRIVFLPGNVPPEAVAFYVNLLKQVREKPEWKDYIERSSQTDRFLIGADLKSFMASDEENAKKVFQKEGWLEK